jgi:SAM-dependent methyltransferase
MSINMNVNTPEMEALKARQKATWMSGDYTTFATYLFDGAKAFLDICDIPAGVTVLDVGCGAGQTALPMARKGSKVKGVDIASNLIADAKKRAQAEGLKVEFEEGDAEDLPADDASYDVVFSLIGAMFAPQPEKVAAEFARVCKPGGRIVMGNWTPSGFVGQMFKTLGKHVPPPAGIPSPLMWGDETTARERLGEYVSDLQLTRRLYPFKYPFGAAEVADFFFKFYGPTNRAYNSLDADKQSALRYDMEQLWAQHNQATDGTLYLESEYLDVQGIRR